MNASYLHIICKLFTIIMFTINKYKFWILEQDIKSKQHRIHQTINKPNRCWYKLACRLAVLFLDLVWQPVEVGQNAASDSGLLQHQVPVHQRELRLETLRLHRELVCKIFVTGGSKLLRSQIRISKDPILSFFIIF